MNQRAAHWDLFILFVSVMVLVMLAVEWIFALPPEVSRMIGFADNLVCAVFLADFVRSFVKAPNRAQYMLHWGWVDLLASVPQIEALRVLRVARVLRILRVVKAVHRAMMIKDLFLQKRAESAASIAAMLFVLVVCVCSILILPFERDGGNIRTAEDALWWSFTTVTTVGYGDRFPVTPAGRIVAALLMTMGVGLFATMSGVLASWILGGSKKSEVEMREELHAVKASLARVEEALERIKSSR